VRAPRAAEAARLLYDELVKPAPTTEAIVRSDLDNQ
jgi:hypothetical protein